MEQATSRFSGNGSGLRDPEQIQREIEATRAELADTVAAVVERVNLKRRAQERAQRGADAARERAVPVAIGFVAVGATAVAAWVLIQRRNESRWDRTKRWSRQVPDRTKGWSRRLLR